MNVNVKPIGWRAVKKQTIWRRTFSGAAPRIALALVVLVVAIAVLGPLVSPFPYDAIVGPPFDYISGEHWLGTDYLGRDAFSRFLNGGVTVLIVAVLGTVLAYLIAVPIGIVSGVRRGSFDTAIIVISDVVYALPPAILLLVLLAATGPSIPTVLLGIIVVHIPRILRIVRLITIDVATREYVEAAFARGESWLAIGFNDILPNVIVPVLADFGVRLCVSIILYASLSYLGLGLAPPAADWGLMISENRIGISISPWIAVAPALAVAAFSVSINVLADSFARSVGRSGSDSNG